MAKIWKPGDIVRLGTADRDMVVKSTEAGGVVICQWLDENGVPKQAEFPVEWIVDANPSLPNDVMNSSRDR